MTLTFKTTRQLACRLNIKPSDVRKRADAEEDDSVCGTSQEGVASIRMTEALNHNNCNLR